MTSSCDTIFKRGDVLKVSILQKNDIPPEIQRMRKILINENVTTVIIHSRNDDGNYTAIKCTDHHGKGTTSIQIGDTLAYAYFRHYFIIDPDSLVRCSDAELRDKNASLEKIENKHNINAVQRAKKKEKRRLQREKQALVQSSSSKNKLPEKNNKKQIKILNGYTIVPLKNTNPKAYKKRICLTNYVCSRCLVCHRPLQEDFINIIPINETEGFRVPGKYCIGCDWFVASEGNALEEIISELPFRSDYELHSEYIDPYHAQKDQFIQSADSASVFVHIKRKNENCHKHILIVTTPSDIDHSNNKYYYTELFARQLLCAIYYNPSNVWFNGAEYEILRYAFIDQGRESVTHYIHVEQILLRSGGGLYHGIADERIELVNILLYSPRTKCFEIIHASYDPEYDLYYIDGNVFRNFLLNYGKPDVLVDSYENYCGDFHKMKEESFLHAYGYTVSQNAGLSPHERQTLLAEILDCGYMSTHNILCQLEYNINMHPGHKYANARVCWEADKKFVMNYKVNPSRFVLAIG